jgi:nucleoside-diphosphate kinase
MERTLVLIKPDGVARGIIGEILHRFERTGLKIIGMKLVWPTEELADQHYPKDDAFISILGSKTLGSYQEKGLDPMEELGMTDQLEIGQFVRGTLTRSLTWGPVVAFVLEGNEAISQVRMMTGSTLPSASAPGTIRGDFSVDSAAMANKKKRALRNIIHASGNAEEAAFEIKLWFHDDELVSYSRSDENVMFEHI